METAPRPLFLAPTVQDVLSDRWRRRATHALFAVAIHLVPFALLLVALPSKPKDIGGVFGHSVAVTLVSGMPPRPVAPLSQSAQPSLTNLERRLSDQGPAVADQAAAAATQAAPPTRLSDLFDTQVGAPGQAVAKGPPRPTTGGDDDPFARASVSYRGDDPAKTASLRSKAQGCARGARALRLLLIINSEGYLVARPRLLGAVGSDKTALKAINAIERCAPFTEAATPGPPRSYEIELG